MFYQNLEEIPSKVREVLPVPAWSVYLNAFNNAWRSFKPGGLARDFLKAQAPLSESAVSREELAHEVAMSVAQWPGFNVKETLKVK